MNTQLDIFYNTVQLSGPLLKARKQRTGSQNQIIYTFFERHPNLNLTPFEVQKALNLRNVPITSIRRSLSDLTRKFGLLEMTGEMKQERYGEMNHKWKLK